MDNFIIGDLRVKDDTICRRCGIKLNNWRDVLYNLWVSIGSTLCHKCRRKQRLYELKEAERLEELGIE